MGQGTDGPTPWEYAQALGYAPGSYAVPGAGYGGGYFSGSATDGPRIIAAPPQAPEPVIHYSAPTPAAPPPAPAPAPAPPPAAAAPEPAAPAPEPAAPIVPIDPGGPIDQPTTAGNLLGGAVLNPPKFFVGGVNEYNKAKAKGTQGSIQTTQT